MIDLLELQKMLPHRYPFLLLDRIVELTPGVKLTGYKNVTINEPFFQGHFPNHPVMPGVLILEALAQAAMVLACKSGQPNDPAYQAAYLMAIDAAKFRRPVVPGDRLQLDVEVLKRKGPVWKTRGVATVDGKKVAEAEFLATQVETAAAPVAAGAPSP